MSPNEITRRAEADEMKRFAVRRIANGDISPEEAVAVLTELTGMTRQEAEHVLRASQDDDGDEGEDRAPPQ